MLNPVYLFVLQPDNSLKIFYLSGFCLTINWNFCFSSQTFRKKLYLFKIWLTWWHCCSKFNMSKSSFSLFFIKNNSVRSTMLISFFNLSSSSHGFVFSVSWKRIAYKIAKKKKRKEKKRKKEGSELLSPW